MRKGNFGDDTVTPNCIECGGFDNTHGNGWQTLLKLSIPHAQLNNFMVRQGDKYFWTFKDSILRHPIAGTQTDYNGFADSLFSFTARQQYRFAVKYKICGNINDVHQSPGAVNRFNIERVSEIVNLMWLTGDTTITLGNYQNFGKMPNTIYDPYFNTTNDMESHSLAFAAAPSYCPTCAKANESNFANKFVFYCESYSSVFNFYSTDILPVVQLSHAGCANKVLVYSGNSFARNNPALAPNTFRDLFPYEFKVPMLFPARIIIDTIPAHYALDTSAVIYSQYSPATGDTTKHFHINVSGALSGDTLTLDTTYFSSLYHSLSCFTGDSIPHPGTYPHLAMADEWSAEIIELTLHPDCNAQNGTIPASDSDQVFIYGDNTSGCTMPAGDTSVNCNSSFEQENIITVGNSYYSPKPNFRVHFSPVLAYATNTEACWTVDISNMNVAGTNTDAPYTFLSVPPEFRPENKSRQSKIE